MEGDTIHGVYFLMSGHASYVLPIFDNVPYINIEVGNHFLVADIVGSMNILGVTNDEWFQNKNSMLCQFTTQAKEDIEIQIFKLEDIQKMQCDFLECYDSLFKDALQNFKKQCQIKKNAIKECSVKAFQSKLMAKF